MMETTEQTTRGGKFPIKWIAGALVIAGVLAASRILPVGSWLEATNAWVADLGPAGGAVYVVLYALCAILFIPGSALTIAAGLIFGLLWGTVVVSLGSTLGAAGAFLIARYFARVKVEHMARGNEKFQAIDRAIGQRGWKIVAMLRLSPVVPYTLSNYLYGLTSVRFWPYVAASWLAMLPGTVLYVYLGRAGGAALQAASGGAAKSDPLQGLYLAIGLIATVAVTVYLTRMARATLAEVGAAETHEPDEDENDGENLPDATVSGKRGVVLATAITGVLVAGLLAGSVQAGLFTRLFGPKRVTLREAYEKRPNGPTFDHSRFDALLKKHVTGDKLVNYDGLRNDAAELDAYLGELAKADFDSLGRNEKLALLINAYNAFTLRLILDKYPLDSIKDIPSKRRWDDDRWTLAGRKLSLSQIENDYLRVKFKDPRVHFAINCASMGCPPLRAEAYTGARIEEQLQAQARYVHSHDRWFRYDAGRRTVYATAIYNWYESDFEQVADSVAAFAARFTDKLDEKSAKHVKVKYMDYDWSLNRATR